MKRVLNKSIVLGALIAQLILPSTVTADYDVGSGAGYHRECRARAYTQSALCGLSPCRLILGAAAAGVVVAGIIILFNDGSSAHSHS